jgi:hypothetical protein
MYKSRITRWKLDKKHKKHKMRAILQKRKRGTVGEELMVDTMEQTRELCDIRFGSLMDLSKRKFVIDNCVSMHAASIPQTIEIPQVLSRPEDLLRHIGQYFKGSFESGTWVSLSEDENWINIKHRQKSFPLDDFVKCCETASKLLKVPNRKVETWVLINRAAAAIKDVLEAEHPNTLQEFLIILSRFRRQRWPQIASNLVKQLMAMAVIVRPVSDPLYQIFKLLCSFEDTVFDEITYTASEALLSLCENMLGPLHRTTLAYKMDFISQGHKTGRLRLEDREHRLRAIYQACEQSLKPTNARLLRVRRRLSHVLIRLGRWTEAQQSLQASIDVGPQIERPADFASDHSRTLYRLAQIQHYQCKDDLALLSLRRAIDVHVGYYGLQDARAIDMLGKLEAYLSEFGREAEAAKTRSKRLKIVEQMDACI